MPQYLRRGVSARRHTYLTITLGFKVGAVVGFEPTASRLKTERALLLLHTAIWLPELGSNQQIADSKSAALPFGYPANKKGR